MPYPIQRISDVLQKLEEITYTTALDLNMGYHIIQLDPDSQILCTIITRGMITSTYGFPWE